MLPLWIRPVSIDDHADERKQEEYKEARLDSLRNESGCLHNQSGPRPLARSTIRRKISDWVDERQQRERERERERLRERERESAK